MVLGTLIDGILDGLNASPNIILPSQLPRSSQVTAEMRLYFAVLEDAIRIFKKQGALRKPQVRQDVMEWFFDDSGRGPFSFRGICDVFGINPEAFRDRIRADTVRVPIRRTANRAA